MQIKVVAVVFFASAGACFWAGCSVSASRLDVLPTAELGFVDPARQYVWREPTAEARRAEATERNPQWGAQIVRAVRAGELVVGMDRAQVRAARGEPAGYGKNPEQGATRWVFPGRVFVSFDEGGRVVAVEEK